MTSENTKLFFKVRIYKRVVLAIKKCHQRHGMDLQINVKTKDTFLYGLATNNSGKVQKLYRQWFSKRRISNHGMFLAFTSYNLKMNSLKIPCSKQVKKNACHIKRGPASDKRAFGHQHEMFRAQHKCILYCCMGLLYSMKNYIHTTCAKVAI